MKYLIPILCLIVTSCASYRPYGQRFVVEVDALAGNADHPQVYTLLPLDSAETGSQLLNDELKRFVANALEISGITVEENDSPDQVIFYDYGISDPRVRFRNDWLTFRGCGYRCVDYGVYYGHPHRISYFQPGFYAWLEVYHQKYLRLYAYDVSKEEPVPLWSIVSSSKGRENDLRKAFPFLLAGAQPFFGRSSGEILEKVIFENHPDVVALQEKTLGFTPEFENY